MMTKKRSAEKTLMKGLEFGAGTTNRTRDLPITGCRQADKFSVSAGGEKAFYPDHFTRIG